MGRLRGCSGRGTGPHRTRCGSSGTPATAGSRPCAGGPRRRWPPGELAVLPGKGGVQIQKDHLFFLRRLFHQIVIDEQVVVFQIAGPAGLGDDVLVEGDEPLDVDDRVGLALADEVDGLAVGLVKALIVAVAQLIDPQGEVDLPVLLQGQGLQEGVLGPVDGEDLFLRQLENGQAVGGEVFSAADAAVEEEAVVRESPMKAASSK